MADAQTGEPRRAGWVGWAGTLEQYQLSSGASLAISVAPSAACGRLGHLHAGSVWNGAVHLAQLIEEGLLRDRLRGRTVIELGAGAGLPSLVALATAPDDAPRCVVLTDYDDPDLTANLQQNVERNASLLASNARVCGHSWGTAPVAALRAAAELDGSQAGSPGFDVVLAADCLWNSEPYEGLLQSLAALLRPGGEVWLAHCHHWEGHEADDRAFFARAEALGFRVERWDAPAQRRTYACLFEDGEEQESFLHRLSWDAGKASQ